MFLTNEVQYLATLKTKIDNWPPPEQEGEDTHEMFLPSFSLWNCPSSPQSDRVLRGWWSVSVCFGSVCDIGFYQLLRLTICFQPLPLRNSESESKYKLLYECLRLLPHFRCLTYNQDIFFSACVWQNTGQSVTTCEWKLRALKRDGNSVGSVHRLELISPEWTNRCVTFSALQRL